MINLLRDHLLDSDLVYGNETTVQVLKEPGRKAQTKSYMWAQINGSGKRLTSWGIDARRALRVAAESPATSWKGLMPGVIQLQRHFRRSDSSLRL